MNQEINRSKEPYQMKFDIGTIKHLGLQMYSTLPSVIGELVANSWDADATKVEITIPNEAIGPSSEIVLRDDGIGMSDDDVRHKYLIIGRDRRDEEKADHTPARRPIMGRKGIGKFSAFGIAREIAVESVKKGEVSHFCMNYDELLKKAENREIELPQLPPTEKDPKGTKVTLRDITKFRTRRIPIDMLRLGLARRFAVIGAQYDFEVVINGAPISPKDRNLKRLLDKDMNGELYLWEYDDEPIKPGTDWTVSGWIGALERTSPTKDKVDRGIVLMARGKLVQEPFVFDAVGGQQFAFSYLIGELHVEFVDEAEDTIGTNRNALVWDTEANAALKKWGQKEVNRIAREWSAKRRQDNERQLQENQFYIAFQEKAAEFDKTRALKLADRLIRQAIDKNPIADTTELEPLIQNCLDFLEFDAFWEIANDLTEAELEDPGKLLDLFREWQIVEAKEMARVTEGRIATIEKLQKLIETNALEVPTLHNFLREFPWVIDPRWDLVADEISYTSLLREHFPQNSDVPETNRRIDFLCVSERTNLVVVEIKRPKSQASVDDLLQIERYVNFLRARVRQSTDSRYEDVTGYLLCGGLVNNDEVREKKDNLAAARIYIRMYTDLLETVKRVHAEFLDRYRRLREAKQKEKG